MGGSGIDIVLSSICRLTALSMLLLQVPLRLEALPGPSMA